MNLLAGANSARIGIALRYVLPAFLTGIVIGSRVLPWALGKTQPSHSVDKYDYNHDGTPDLLMYYSNGLITQLSADRNFDGKLDYIEYFNNEGVISRAKADDDFDGHFDTLYLYTNGWPLAEFRDVDSNGIPDVISSYSNGVLVATIWQPNGTGAVLRTQTWRDGTILEETFLNTNEGTSSIVRTTFDRFGRQQIRSTGNISELPR